MLAERFQISESLMEECEAVGRRDPHAKWPRSVFFNGAATGVFDCCYAGAGGSMIVCMWLEGVSPMVEEFRWPFELAVGYVLWRDTALVTAAHVFDGFLLVALPGGGGGGGVSLCCVRLCVVLVVYASARYVRIFLLLI